ncbi:Retrovirus-related Pol polyprotein from transposon TNT 1-94 [Abeliophyllum distichum]|uniref:Retrovirus-related Pol polyprotein from transposon TNT 1-94 n=1 Tax=Abeliophyllum distichum TaxID=126358 RepID=A0ABD1UGN8_9LAMI
MVVDKYYDILEYLMTGTVEKASGSETEGFEGEELHVPSNRQNHSGYHLEEGHLKEDLRKDFETLEMKVAENVTDYFARVMTVANKMRVSNGEEQTLKVTSEEKFRGRGHGRNTFRRRGRCRGRQVLNRATVECYRCHKLGHFQYECPTWDKEANYAELDDEEEMLLMSYVEMHETNRENAWFLDSGCSNHMCGDKDVFSELDESFRQFVKLGNNTRINVLGKGNVRLHLNGFNHVVT